ncbi:MAG: APC family permease [Hyphomicrobiales bacterium]|nr:MAG: APC family permease [Hyphomicrobiales bacterium]
MVHTSSPDFQASDSAADSPAHLESGHLSRGSLVSLSLASFIPAVGMALLPVLLLSTAGSTAWSSSLLTAVIVSCVGIAVITFARRYISTGSLYSYIGEVFGPWARYLTAAALLAGYVAQIAAIAATVGIFTGSFLASQGFENSLGFGVQAVVIFGAILIAAAVAYRGLDTSVRVAVTLALLSVPLMVVITVMSAANTGLDLGQQFAFGSLDFGGTMQGVAAGAAWLIGFESCTSLAAESKDPRKNVPLAVMAAPVVLGVVYVLSTVLQVPGLTAAAEAIDAGMSAPAALALQSGLGASVANVTDLVLAIASFAALIGFINYGSRFVMSIGEDGLLPRFMTRIHPRFHSPHVAVVSMAVLGFIVMAILELITGDIVSAYAMATPLIAYCWVAPYILICAGAVVLSWRLGERSIVVLISAVVGAAGIGWMYINGWIDPPPPPTDAMLWVSILVIVATLAIILVTKRRMRSSGGSETTNTLKDA